MHGDLIGPQGYGRRVPPDALRQLVRDAALGSVKERAYRSGDGKRVRDFPVIEGEFWTSRQRAAHSLHEISYRACFKPQLPRFFIERLTSPGERVYDPFMGRGTTLLEAGLLGRVPLGTDVNPLAGVLAGPRLEPPEPDEVEARLAAVDWNAAAPLPESLLVFFHEATLRALGALREHLRRSGCREAADRWLQMVALNRLTGHSPGFFSVYTMPPNQAVSAERQRLLNLRRAQEPPFRDVPSLLLRKSRSLLSRAGPETRASLARVLPEACLRTGDAAETPWLPPDSVHLVVTSPPFLDVVDYAADNWLRCWFIDVDPAAVPMSVFRRLTDWEAKMRDVFRELRRVLVPGGYVAFEVGEVRGGRVLLEDPVVEAATAAGLEPALVMIHRQEFTKTANCWGVSNNRKGTNTNRLVLLRKAE